LTNKIVHLRKKTSFENTDLEGLVKHRRHKLNLYPFDDVGKIVGVALFCETCDKGLLFLSNQEDPKSKYFKGLQIIGN